jgi:hypothetical protein
MFTRNTGRSLYIISMAGVAFSLPLSEWLLSVFIIAVVFAWISAGGLRRIPLLLNEKKIILIFLLSYLIYIVWMLNTSDIMSGMTQLRLKLPLLIFPVVTGLSDPLDPGEQKTLITSFITGVVVSSAAGIITGIGPVFTSHADPKMLSPFISHIRLSLMCVFAIACSGWYFHFHRSGKWYDWLFVAAAIWLTIFLYLLLSLTGIILFLLTIAVSSLLIAKRSGSRSTRLAIPILLSVGTIIFTSVITLNIISFYKPGTAYTFPLKDMTEAGNQYFHDTCKKDTENGNLVWIYLCDKELGREWEKHSTIKYEGSDKMGQILKFTLIRYLTSAGFTKDSAGFSGMTERDIDAVENGITNRNFLIWKPWRTRLYEIIWQLDYYKRGGNPSGHSLTQRLVFFRTGINIFSRHPIFGTGTGDLSSEYSEQYLKERSILDPSHRLLSHNQFLSFMISFGLTGSVIIIWALFFPFISLKGYKRYLPSVFFMLLVLSMLWEDTLETHTGVSFFAYFYSVLIFGTEYNEGRDKKK